MFFSNPSVNVSRQHMLPELSPSDTILHADTDGQTSCFKTRFGGLDEESYRGKH